MNFPFRRRHGVVGTAFAAALFLCILPLARAQSALPHGAVDIGPVPSSQTISITLHLSPSPAHQAALMQFLSDVQTSGSPAYHQWLTPAQFGTQFGATASQVADINTFAAANNLAVSNVSASGLRFTLTGTVASLESAMAPALHQVQLAGSMYYANTATPTLPSTLAAEVTTIDGLNTLPGAYPLTIAGTAVDDPLAALSSIIDADVMRVLSISSSACLEDFSATAQAALQNELRQASAQGITVLAASNCGSRGSAGFPSALSEVTAVAVAPGITPATSPVLTELRPAWQVALGLPSDSFRHEVDLTVSSLDALAQKVTSVIATQTENNAPLRLGNINATIYQNATTKSLFTQPDNATPGTWEPATGLGLTDLTVLGNVIWHPHGTHNTQVQVYPSPYYITHGQQVSVYATITDSSYAVGYTPTGNITFTTSPINSSTTAFNQTVPTTASSTAIATTQTLTTNQLNYGNYNITATYYGDGTYAGSSGTQNISVGAEPSVLSVSSPPSTVTVGQNFSITVTDKSGSGVDTPTGTIVITEYGSTTLTYTQPLVASGTGVATATFSIPAAQGGTINLSINCNSTDTNFTCYAPITQSLTVTQAATTTTLVSDPTTFIAGQQVALHATVTLTTPVAGFTPTFTGNVVFYDNGNNIGTSNISGNGLATVVATIAGAGDTITAVYSGDGSYMSSTGTLNGTGSTGPSNTSASLTVNPTSGLAGSNYILTATVSTANSGNAANGTVTFYDTLNGGQQAVIGSAALAASGPSLAIGQLSTTGLQAGTHMLVAKFSGTTSFGASTTNTVTLNLTDYSLTFSPSTMTLSAGTNGVDLVTVNSVNGFKGTVTLSCTAPANTQTTCVFNPSTITNSGNSQLLITTMAPQERKAVVQAGFDGKILGTALTALLLGILLPSVRRRRPALCALLVSCVLLVSSGCTNLDNVAPIVPITGTPLGTQVFTIRTSGTDGVTTTHHNSTLQVTVQ